MKPTRTELILKSLRFLVKYAVDDLERKDIGDLYDEGLGLFYQLDLAVDEEENERRTRNNP